MGKDSEIGISTLTMGRNGITAIIMATVAVQVVVAAALTVGEVMAEVDMEVAATGIAVAAMGIVVAAMGVAIILDASCGLNDTWAQSPITISPFDRPRSPRIRLGGLVVLARMVDRATVAEKNGSYIYNSPTDQHLVRLWHMTDQAADYAVNDPFLNFVRVAPVDGAMG